MQSTATSPEAYIEELPQERKEPVSRLRKTILENLPEGFEETMNYGMIGYVVPHSIYPDGYHCDPEQALPFMSLASQKHYIAVYSSSVYSDPELLKWFTESYAERCRYKLDMGKSCIRFKRMDDIPYDLIGELAAKVTVEEFVDRYESIIKKR